MIKAFNHLNQNNYSSVRPVRTSNQGLGDEEDESLINENNLSSDEHPNLDAEGGVNEDSSSKLFVSITVTLLLASFLIAVQVERLEIVLGFVGSTGSTTISYILPGLFFLKLFPEVDHQNKLATRRTEEEEDQDNRINLEPNSLNEGNEYYAGQLDSFELKVLRKLALVLVLVGFFVMVVCLSLNIHDAFF